jgi:hypothetical protein
MKLSHLLIIAIYKNTWVINMIIKELNVNCTHDRMKQIEVISHKFFFSPEAENS